MDYKINVATVERVCQYVTTKTNIKLAFIKQNEVIQMTRYLIIQREHEAQDIKSVMALPLTVQQNIALFIGNLDEVHNYIEDNNLLDEDVFVIPYATHMDCTIGRYRAVLENTDIGIEVDNASNSIQWFNRVFTFMDKTKNSDGLTQLHFIELVKDEDNVGYTPDMYETLTITLCVDDTKVQTITRRDNLVFVNLVSEQMLRRGA